MDYADETNILEDRVERAEAEVARLRGFIERLISDCELGQHVGSNIGVVWLKEQCEAALSTPADVKGMED